MPSFDASSRRRDPAWSGPATSWAAGRIPGSWRPATLTFIKGFHTAVFVSVAATIVLFVWDGFRGSPSRRTARAMGVALAEAAVYVSNNQVCPLTPLAEKLGAESGAVADIFLPDWLARRIPLISGSALLLGAAMNLRALAGRRSPPA